MHQDIWDDMKTRPHFSTFLTSKNINNEPQKNFLRFAPTNIPDLEEDHSVNIYFQEDRYQRRRTFFPHQNSLKVCSQHVHGNDKVCTWMWFYFRGGLQELLESVTYGEGVHLSKEPMFSFMHTFIVPKGRIWTNKVRLQLLSMLIFLNDEIHL